MKIFNLKNLFKKETINKLDLKEINFNWLKNNEEKKLAFNLLKKGIPEKFINLNDSEIDRIINDDEISTTALIINEFQNVCCTIWKDDLNENNTYKDILLKFLKQTSFGEISEINDGYLNVDESSYFNLSFSYKEKKYSMELKKNIYLNYEFLKLLIRLANTINASGSFYLVENENFEDGYTFIYLENKEYKSITEHHILKLILLTEEVIDEINCWIK